MSKLVFEPHAHRRVQRTNTHTHCIYIWCIPVDLLDYLWWTTHQQAAKATATVRTVAAAYDICVWIRWKIYIGHCQLCIALHSIASILILVLCFLYRCLHSVCVFIQYLCCVVSACVWRSQFTIQLDFLLHENSALIFPLRFSFESFTKFWPYQQKCKLNSF